MANLSAPTRMGTTWVLVVIGVVLIAWDIYAMKSPTQPTISALILFYARKYLMIPVSFGVLIGHFFWPQVETEKPSC